VKQAAPAVEHVTKNASPKLRAANLPDAGLAVPLSSDALPIQRKCACGGTCPRCEPKYRIGKSDDVYEHEADHVADQVMALSPAKVISRTDKDELLQTKPLAERITPMTQSQTQEEEKEELAQSKSIGASQPSGEGLSARVAELLNTGRPLSNSERAFYEPRFGTELGHVRIHPGQGSLARDVNARAFTIKNHIVFGQGEYAPTTDRGRHLLAHELTHVLQQGSGKPGIQRKLSTEEKAMDLQSDRLRDDVRLQQAYDNSPVLERGETSKEGGVKILQRALRDLGYDMTISFEKTGDADGVYGRETRDAVHQFQIDNDLVYKDGRAGRETLGELDDKFLGAQTKCNITYFAGGMSPRDKDKFIIKNFEVADRPAARKVLDDLCEVQTDVLTFSSEQELRDEIMKRIRISKYTQESQTAGAFGYPETASREHCPGKTGNSLTDAQVNLAARAYWEGPKLEERSFIKNKHYYFALTDTGKQNGYEALTRLFTTQSNFCDRTLIHCDTLITMVQSLAYADTIGKDVFNQKIKSGNLYMWLTYDGMTIKEGGSEKTAVSASVYYFRPSNENDLVIGDHVVFWNHLAYDAISVRAPGPWRLENAILVDKDSSGKDLYEGHGAPAIGGTVKPGDKDSILTDLKNAYNAHASDAVKVTKKVDKNEAGAKADLNTRYPRVVPSVQKGTWLIKETDENMKYRKHQYYVLREITSTSDPELIGLKDPQDPSKMNTVRRPVESR
jgi:hypothetical protein